MGNHSVINFYKSSLFLILAYLVLHSLIRLFFNDSIQVDDREQLYYAQSLSLGYPMPQPPLYSWLSYIFFKIFGSGLTALTLLKYSLIFLTFVYVNKISKRIFSNEWIKENLVYFFLLMPSFAWHMHQGFTHTILLGLGIVMSIYYFFKIIDQQSLKNFALLGLSLSIGILGKYSFILFIALSLFAILSIKEYRALFICWKALVVPTIFLVLISPHLTWLIDHWSLIYSQANDKLNIESTSNSNFETIFQLIKSFIGFLIPLIFIFFFIDRKTRKKIENKKKPQLQELFLNRFLVLLAIFVIIFSIFFEIKLIRVRWLHPVLMIFPFWLAFYFEKRNLFVKTFQKKFFSLVFFLTLLIFFVRVAQNTIGPSLGFHGRLNLPISSSLISLPKEIIDSASVIKTQDINLGVHLFEIFPNKSIIIGNKKFNTENGANGKCLYLLDQDGHSDSSLQMIQKNYGSFNKIESKDNNFNYVLLYKLLDKKIC